METIKVKDVARFLETLAPAVFQENYDNSGLLTGDPEWTVTGILTTLDCVEGIVEEAIQKKCNLIVAHHPIVFKGLKKLTGRNYVERTVIKAIKHDIAIFAVHTNLDNVLHGVNQKIAQQLGLKNCTVLVPKKDTLVKLVTFVPSADAPGVLRSLHEAGAGNLGDYKNCSFQTTGTGSFTSGPDARPHIGSAGTEEQVEEVRLEVILPRHAQNAVVTALKKAHPYQEVAHYLTLLENENQEVGSGLIGELSRPEEPIAFLQRLKNVMNTSCVRFTAIGTTLVQKVAVCGGSGSFLLGDAIKAGAQAFVSADFKYHEFFDAEGKILIADIGHYESESYTKQLLSEVLREKFTTFAINFSEQNTNPISYL